MIKAQHAYFFNLHRIKPMSTNETINDNMYSKTNTQFLFESIENEINMKNEWAEHKKPKKVLIR